MTSRTTWLRASAMEYLRNAGFALEGRMGATEARKRIRVALREQGLEAPHARDMAARLVAHAHKA